MSVLPLSCLPPYTHHCPVCRRPLTVVLSAAVHSPLSCLPPSTHHCPVCRRPLTAVLSAAVHSSLSCLPPSTHRCPVCRRPLTAVLSAAVHSPLSCLPPSTHHCPVCRRPLTTVLSAAVHSPLSCLRPSTHRCPVCRRPLTAVLSAGDRGQVGDGAVDDEIPHAADVPDPARAGPHLRRHRHPAVVRAQTADVQRASQVQTVVGACWQTANIRRYSVRADRHMLDGYGCLHTYTPLTCDGCAAVTAVCCGPTSLRLQVQTVVSTADR